MKVAIIRILGLVLIIGSAAAAQQIAPQSDAPCGALQSTTVNWSQFHFDPCHTGYNRYETILSPATVGNLVLAWKDTNDLEGGAVWSSPAVVGGVVFFGDWGVGDVYAVDAHTGDVRWNWRNDGGEIGSPAVAYGKVYVADPDQQTIDVLDARNGHRVSNWGNDLPRDIPGDVTVANGAIYVAWAHMGNSHWGWVYAIDANTGDTLWSRLMQTGAITSPAVSNGRVYVECTPDAEFPENLCSMDAATGEILWQVSLGRSWSFYQPAVSNGVVYVGTSEMFYNPTNNQDAFLTYASAFDAVSGAMLWQRALTPAVSNGGTLPITPTTPAVANGVIYIGIGSRYDDSYGYMYAINAATGAILWTYKTAGGIYSSAAVANGVVYFGSDDKNIYALDATTGALLWKYTTGGAVRSSPAVVNGIVFVGSGDEYMYAFHLPG